MDYIGAQQHSQESWSAFTNFFDVKIIFLEFTELCEREINVQIFAWNFETSES